MRVPNGSPRRGRIPARTGEEAERLMDEIGPSPFSRRGFLKAAVVLPAAGYLASCSQEVGPQAADPTTPAEGSATAELESELNIYNWAAYLNPASRKAFAKEFDVETTLDFYSSNEELIAKLQGGAGGYDIVAPTGYAVQIMADEGLLYELDHERIPNMSNVDPRFLGLSFDPENAYSMPKDWGTTGFGYLQDFVDEEMTTWEDFFTLAEKYSGKYTVLDSSPEVIGAGLKRHGYSYNSTNPDEINQSVDDLIAIKSHIAAITSSEYRQMMSRGDAWVSLGWNGDFFYVLEDQPSVKYVIPEEGTEFWIDAWAIPASAPHPNIAMEWINWILTPENQGRETNYTYYASPVTGAQEFTDEALASDPSIYPEPEVIEALEANSGDPEALDLRSEGWTTFKSA